MFRATRRAVEETELNLIPIMNLFTALVPFLLLSAIFYRIAIIQVTVPVASSTGDTDVAKEEDKVTLTVRIRPQYFQLSAASDVLDPAALKALESRIERGGDAAARKSACRELEERAFAVKSRYTASDTVIVVPDDEVPYEEVVEALDALRDTRREVAGQLSRVSLFPRVVLSSLVK